MGASPDQVRKWAERRPNKRADRGDENAIWEQTLEEAKNAGATLSHDKPGGVDAGRALHLFRRAKWTCELCGAKDELELDHLSGHPDITPTEVDYGHENSNRDLQVVCADCQDAIHGEDNKIRNGKEEDEDGESREQSDDR